MASPITVSTPAFPAFLPAGIDNTLYTGNIAGLVNAGASAFPPIVNEGLVPAEFANVVKPGDVTERSLAKDAARFASEVPLELVVARAFAGGANVVGEEGVAASAILAGMNFTATRTDDGDSMMAISDGIVATTSSPRLVPALAGIRDNIVLEQTYSGGEKLHGILRAQLSGKKDVHFWVRVDGPRNQLFVNAPAGSWAIKELLGGGLSYFVDILAFSYGSLSGSVRDNVDILRDIVIKLFSDAINDREENPGKVDLERASEILRKAMVAMGIFEDWSLRFWKKQQDKEFARNIIVSFAKAIFPQLGFDKHGGMQIVGAGNSADR